MGNRDIILEDAQCLFAFLSYAEEGPESADMILAMGSQDLMVANTAAHGFFKKSARWLVCSGGLGKDTAAVFLEPEGVLYARRFQQLGVPADRILVEQRATNSGENFQYSRALLEERGIFPRSGAIACKPYMARRAWATGMKQWPEVSWSVVRPALSFMEYIGLGNDLTTVLELMVGDLQRMRVYGGRFQIPVAVPDDVWTAYERLVAAGFDRYVIQEN